MKSLENSRKLKENDLKMIRRIRRKKLLIHSNWIAVFNSIIDEDNFYRRKGLIELLETYVNQDVLQTGSLQFDGQIMTNSYLNTSKFFYQGWLEVSSRKKGRPIWIALLLIYSGNFFQHVKKILKFWNFLNIKVAKFKLNHLGLIANLVYFDRATRKVRN